MADITWETNIHDFCSKITLTESESVQVTAISAVLTLDPRQAVLIVFVSLTVL